MAVRARDTTSASILYFHGGCKRLPNKSLHASERESTCKGSPKKIIAPAWYFATGTGEDEDTFSKKGFFRYIGVIIICIVLLGMMKETCSIWLQRHALCKVRVTAEEFEVHLLQTASVWPDRGSSSTMTVTARQTGVRLLHLAWLGILAGPDKETPVQHPSRPPSPWAALTHSCPSACGPSKGAFVHIQAELFSHALGGHLLLKGREPQQQGPGQRSSWVLSQVKGEERDNTRGRSSASHSAESWTHHSKNSGLLHLLFITVQVNFSLFYWRKNG